MEEDEYTIVVDGKPQGPYKLSELAGHLRPDTFVRKPGMDDYREAHEMPELRSHFGFLNVQIAPQYFASFDQRVVADLIDYFMVLLVALLFLFIAYTVASLNIFRLIGLGLIILLPFARLIYGAVAEASPKQATIGKRLMDIRVTDGQGMRLSLANSMGRNFAKIISNIPLGLGYLYCFLSKKQQCLHDVIADTLVVKDRLI